MCIQDQGILILAVGASEIFESLDRNMKKRNLYIHLGPAKTGTSAIQKFLMSNEELLSGKGFHYVETLRHEDGGHHPLAWILYHKYSNIYMNILYGIPYVAQRDKLLQDLIYEINNSPAESVILTSEAIPFLSEEAIAELLDLFPNMSVKAILYIRNFREQALSLAAQVIKNQDSINDDRLSNIYAHLEYFYKSYLKCIDVLTKKIGRNNLIFRKYGTRFFKGGNIYEDFLDAMDLSLTDDFVIPEGTQNESLRSCESIYFKDILNRLTLKTPQDILEAQLLAWDKTNDGTKFFLPKDISIKVEQDALNVHRYLLDNYLDPTYIDLFDSTSGLNNSPKYELTYDTFLKMTNHIDSHIVNFKKDLMQSLVNVLDRDYEYELGFRSFDVIFRVLTQNNKPIVLWGCGSIADKLFQKHNSLFTSQTYIVDHNSQKHGHYLFGREIRNPSIINDKQIDTVIITSIAHADEIAIQISESYPSVKCVISLSECITTIQQTIISHLSSEKARPERQPVMKIREISAPPPARPFFLPEHGRVTKRCH